MILFDFNKSFVPQKAVQTVSLVIVVHPAISRFLCSAKMELVFICIILVYNLAESLPHRCRMPMTDQSINLPG